MDFYLDSLKVSDLKEICKNSGIIGISKLNKQKLIEVMMGCDLKDSGYEPAVIELEKIVPPPLIIFHHQKCRRLWKHQSQHVVMEVMTHYVVHVLYYIFQLNQIH